MKNTFRTLLKTINDTLKTNLTKEVGSFPVKGYRVNQLELPKSPANIVEVTDSEYCQAIETSDSALFMTQMLLLDDLPEEYDIKVYAFRKNELTFYIDKMVGDIKHSINVSFNATSSKIEFGATAINGNYRLDKTTIPVSKAIKLGTYTKIPHSLSAKTFIDMTPTEYTDYVIQDKIDNQLRIEKAKNKKAEEFNVELAKHNISLEDFNKLKRMQPSSY